MTVYTCRRIPRPTREEVDASLQLADDVPNDSGDLYVLAAEVQALRDEASMSARAWSELRRSLDELLEASDVMVKGNCSVEQYRAFCAIVAKLRSPPPDKLVE